MPVLSRPGSAAAGVLLLTILTIEIGGAYVLHLSLGNLPATEFQTTFARAGHGHAGVLVILGLLSILLTDAAGLTGWLSHITRWTIPVAAILMPAGFFLSSLGQEVTEPNTFVVLIYLGAVVLALGLAVLGIALLRMALRRR